MFICLPGFGLLCSKKHSGNDSKTQGDTIKLASGMLIAPVTSTENFNRSCRCSAPIWISH